MSDNSTLETLMQELKEIQEKWSPCPKHEHLKIFGYDICLPLLNKYFEHNETLIMFEDESGAKIRYAYLDVPIPGSSDHLIEGALTEAPITKFEVEGKMPSDTVVSVWSMNVFGEDGVPVVSKDQVDNWVVWIITDYETERQARISAATGDSDKLDITAVVANEEGELPGEIPERSPFVDIYGYSFSMLWLNHLLSDFGSPKKYIIAASPFVEEMTLSRILYTEDGSEVALHGHDTIHNEFTVPLFSPLSGLPNIPREMADEWAALAQAEVDSTKVAELTDTSGEQGNGISSPLETDEEIEAAAEAFLKLFKTPEEAIVALSGVTTFNFDDMIIDAGHGDVHTDRDDGDDLPEEMYSILDAIAEKIIAGAFEVGDLVKVDKKAHPNSTNYKTGLVFNTFFSRPKLDGAPAELLVQMVWLDDDGDIAIAVQPHWLLRKVGKYTGDMMKLKDLVGFYFVP